jgi:hypothetical protein
LITRQGTYPLAARTADDAGVGNRWNGCWHWHERTWIRNRRPCDGVAARRRRLCRAGCCPGTQRR